MKRTMFIGAIACGKTTLTQRLEHQQIRYNKTQAVEFTSNIIDTPGEYMEHHNMMSTLRVTSMDADIVVYCKALLISDWFSLLVSAQCLVSQQSALLLKLIW